MQDSVNLSARKSGRILSGTSTVQIFKDKTAVTLISYIVSIVAVHSVKNKLMSVFTFESL